METLAKRLRATRIAAGKTQNDVAQHFEVEKTTVSRWETGTYEPDLKRLSAIVSLFGFDEKVRNWIAFGGDTPKHIARALATRKAS